MKNRIGQTIGTTVVILCALILLIGSIVLKYTVWQECRSMHSFIYCFMTH